MKTVVTNACRAGQLLQYLSSGLKLVVVGGTTAWPVEGNPPDPDVTMLNIPQPVACFPVSKVSVVVQHPDGNIYMPDGTRYYPIIPNNLEQVVTANPAGVLLEAQIAHQPLVQLNIDSYRMAGVLNQCVVSQQITSPTQLIPMSQVHSYVLEIVSYFSPVYTRPQGIHIMRFLRRF